jgi:hypothetical protein
MWKMPEHDTILAILSSGIAVAGLLLVFSGFLMTKAESFSASVGDKYKWLALLSLLPIITALALTWIATDALAGPGWEGYHLLTLFKIQLAITGGYAIIGLIAFIL